MAIVLWNVWQQGLLLTSHCFAKCQCCSYLWFSCVLNLKVDFWHWQLTRTNMHCIYSIVSTACSSSLATCSVLHEVISPLNTNSSVASTVNWKSGILFHLRDWRVKLSNCRLTKWRQWTYIVKRQLEIFFTDKWWLYLFSRYSVHWKNFSMRGHRKYTWF